MSTEPSTELEESEDRKLIALFFPEDAKNGFLSFHNKILLEPKKLSRESESLAKFLNMDVPEKVSNEFDKRVSEEHGEFVRNIILPALKSIDQDGLNSSIHELLQKVLKENEYDFFQEDLDSLKGFLSTPTTDQRIKTLLGIIQFFAQLHKDQPHEMNYGHLELKSWARSFSQRQDYSLLFLAYEILCACAFQILCKSASKSSIDQCLKKIKVLETTEFNICNGQKIRKSRLAKLFSKYQRETGKEANALIQKRESARADGANLKALERILGELYQLKDQQSNSDRVYVAIFSKLYYISEARKNGEPTGRGKASRPNVAQFFDDLYLASECLDQRAECKKTILLALCKFERIAKQNGLARGKGGYGRRRKGSNSDEDKAKKERAEVERRFQYGEDFFYLVDSLMPTVFKEFPEDHWPTDKDPWEEFCKLIDSWLRMALRGAKDNRGKLETGRLPFDKMRNIKNSVVRSNPPLPVLSEIYNATPEGKNDFRSKMPMLNEESN